jgi:hypothetical protein
MALPEANPAATSIYSINTAILIPPLRSAASFLLLPFSISSRLSKTQQEANVCHTV